MQDKYKNEKKLAKQRLSVNKQQMKKTGGGSFAFDNTEDFGFSEKQIAGLANRFDSDHVGTEEEEVEALNSYGFEGIENENIDECEVTLQTPKRSAPQEQSMKYSNKKMKMSAVKDDFYEAKLELMKLDIEYKRMLIEKGVLETEKLQLEVKKLKEGTD